MSLHTAIARYWSLSFVLCSLCFALFIICVYCCFCSSTNQLWQTAASGRILLREWLRFFLTLCVIILTASGLFACMTKRTRPKIDCTAMVEIWPVGTTIRLLCMPSLSIVAATELFPLSVIPVYNCLLLLAWCRLRFINSYFLSWIANSMWYF